MRPDRNAMLALLGAGLLSKFALAAPGASELIQSMEAQMIGKSFQGKATMVIVKGRDERKLSFNAFTKERKFALVKILEPRRDQGTGNLRVDMELWQYLPNVNRVIKIPSSMMIQSWMGSDFTNDDLVKGTNLSKHYTHKLLGEKTLAGEASYQIESTPKPDAPVVWGKLVSWLRKSDQTLLKQEFYSEDNRLVKTLEGSKIRKFGTHTIPTRISMRKHSDSAGQSSVTTVEYDPATVRFDFAIADSFFTQGNLQKANPRP